MEVADFILFKTTNQRSKFTGPKSNQNPYFLLEQMDGASDPFTIDGQGYVGTPLDVR